MTPRLAIITSHPIQYQAPLWRLLTERGIVTPTVFFLSNHGVEPSMDPGLNRVVRFDVPLVEGYDHRFVVNRSPRPAIHGFWGAVHAELVPLLRTGSFDAVMVLGYAQLSDWIAFATAIGSNLPLILRGENPDPPLARRRGLKWQAKRLLLGSVLRRASACAVVGLRNAQYFQSLGATPDQLFWAPYSVNDTVFRERAEIGRQMRDQWLRDLDLDPALPNVVFAAKFIPLKRPFDLIDAVEALPGKAQLLLIGDGPMRAEVDDRIRGIPNVRCLGFLNQSEIAQWYGVADIFALVSDRETWGLAVNEAMAAGAVPVVSDAVGCGPDLVDGGAGRTFPAGDVGALRAAIVDLLDDTVREQARAIGQERLPRYSLAATAQGIEAAVLAASLGRAS